MTMPMIIPGTGSRPAGLGELICADPDLLRAEFDAIIAEAWARPPSRVGTRVTALPGPSRPARAARPGTLGVRMSSTVPAALQHGGWPRSPPESERA